MKQTELAVFTVRILSADNATWQGVVEADGTTFAFQSEMQLLNWLYETYPALIPEIKQKPIHVKEVAK
jgi:hypothetical protein